ACEYHRVPFDDVQHTIGIEMRLNVQRVPVQLPFCRLRAECDAPQHQTDSQRQATSFPCTCVHSRKVYKPASEFVRQLLSQNVIRDPKTTRVTLLVRVGEFAYR